jgi:hypothetical protein
MSVRIANREFAPRSWAVLLTAALLAAFVALGWWQLGRAREKQAMVEGFKDKKVYPANDTTFLGNMTSFQNFDERCTMSGECIIDKTGGICPVTTCPKGILNGPCGGTNNGMCEVSPEIECAWAKIYARMERTGELEKIKEVIPPKDWSKKMSPKVWLIEKKKEGEESK